MISMMKPPTSTLMSHHRVIRPQLALLQIPCMSVLASITVSPAAGDVELKNVCFNGCIKQGCHTRGETWEFLDFENADFQTEVIIVYKGL